MTRIQASNAMKFPQQSMDGTDKIRVLSVPHITLPTRLQRKSEGAYSSIYDHSLIKSRFGSADSILGLVEPIGKLFIRIRHNSTEEKLILLINKVKDLQLPASVKLSKSLNPVLYIKGGFLPTMGQRFTTKYAPLAEVQSHTFEVQNVTWYNEFSILGVSKSAAWQLTMRLHLCYRENKQDRIQIIGVCDVVLGRINLENSQEITLNFFSSEKQCSDLGDIHVSLCYQPQLRRIVFLILEARDLPRSTLFGSIHSVAKVEMLCSRKRLEKQKSRVVREAHNPVWNNQIVFTVPDANTKLQDILFVVTVLHVDMVKGGHVVGKCELGWSATCEELDQWNQVMQNPNRPIPMWLGLQYPD
ncbi:synaptotagmin-C-like [Asterias rubens]|uniref:synaptotagmin-C-like n=1 Tax=Asterias rubens TaxID=7604 RepID=UPI001455A37D|nr:synaptotagmin-C-like [Asterias rubens]